MRAIAIICIIIVASSSCGLFRKVDKHKYTQKTEQVIRIDSAVFSDKAIRDRYKIVIEEKAKGLYMPPSFGGKINTSFDPDSIVKLKLMATDHNLIQVINSLNELSNGIVQDVNFNPFPVPVDIERKTTKDVELDSYESSTTDFNKGIKSKERWWIIKLRKKRRMHFGGCLVG